MRFIKLLFMMAFLGGLLYAGSYAGARVKTGQYLGSPLPDMGVRTSTPAFGGIPDLPAHPKGWIFTYSSVPVNGNRPAKVFVSFDGKFLGAVPKDLGLRLDAWRRAREAQ